MQGELESEFVRAECEKEYLQKMTLKEQEIAQALNNSRQQLEERTKQLEEALRSNEKLCAKIDEMEGQRQERVAAFDEFHAQYLVQQRRALEAEQELLALKHQCAEVIE